MPTGQKEANRKVTKLNDSVLLPGEKADACRSRSQMITYQGSARLCTIRLALK